MELKEPMGLQDHKVQQVHKVMMGLKVLTEPQDHKAQQGLKEQQVHKVLKVM